MSTQLLQSCTTGPAISNLWFCSCISDPDSVSGRCNC